MFTGIKPIMSVTQGVVPAVAINVDFDSTATTPSIPVSSSIATPWGSLWGSPWTSPTSTLKKWYGATGVGLAGAPHISMAVGNATCKWQSSEVSFQLGSSL
jgi:hypothetical protein